MGKENYKGVMTTEAADAPPQPTSCLESLRSYIRLLTVEPLLFLCVASAVFKFVILPQFLLDTICHRNYDAELCKNITQPENSAKQTQIQISAAKWMLGLFSCSLSISLFTVPLLGSLADVLSKKRTLYIPVGLYAVQSIVYCILSSKSNALSPAYYFIAIIVGGLSGDLVALIMLCCSYLSDITTEEQRTFRLTLLDGTLNLSVCIFVFLSGHIINAVGYTRVFYVALGIDALALCCLTLFIPQDIVSYTGQPEKKGNIEDRGAKESVITGDQINCNGVIAPTADEYTEKDGTSEVGQKNEKSTEEICSSTEKHEASEVAHKKISIVRLFKESNPVRRFKELARLLREQGDTSAMAILLLLLASASMCIVGESLTLVLYIKNHPFNMDAVNVGYLLSLQGLLRFLGGYMLLNIVFQRLCKWRDVNVISLAFAVNVVYYIFLGVANTKKMLYGIQILGVFGPLAGPTLRSIVSKKGNSQNYSIILSLAQTIDAFSSLAVNLIVNSTYFAMVELYPGAFCFALAAISVFGAVMSFVIRRYDKDLQSQETEVVSNATVLHEIQ